MEKYGPDRGGFQGRVHWRGRGRSEDALGDDLEAVLWGRENAAYDGGVGRRWEAFCESPGVQVGWDV